jgi:hypothetical protein
MACLPNFLSLALQALNMNSNLRQGVPGASHRVRADGDLSSPLPSHRLQQRRHLRLILTAQPYDAVAEWR